MRTEQEINMFLNDLIEEGEKMNQGECVLNNIQRYAILIALSVQHCREGELSVTDEMAVKGV